MYEGIEVFSEVQPALRKMHQRFGELLRAGLHGLHYLAVEFLGHGGAMALVHIAYLHQALFALASQEKVLLAVHHL